MEKISIIIPIYNAEQFLEQCLNSVLCQPFDNIEVICVDDGSEDNTLVILQSYKKRDSRIQIYTQNHKGAGAARNFGLRVSTGKYVHFLDADDWIRPSIYTELIPLMERERAEVSMFQYFKFDNRTKVLISPDIFDAQKELPLSKTLCFTDAPAFFLYNSVVPWNKLYLRSFLVTNNLLFDELTCANDRTFYFHMLLCKPQIVISFERYLYYRINNPAALTGSKRSKNFDCHFRSFENIIALYKETPIEIQRMILDISMKDFIGFYRGRSGEDKWIIYQKLHQYFQALDLSVLGNDIIKYNWYPEYKIILESPYFLGERNPDFFLNDKAYQDMKDKCSQLLRERNNARKERDNYKKENNRLKTELKNIQSSKTYRFFHLVTAIPKKVGITIKYWKENGTICTLDQIYLNLFKRNSELNGLVYGLTRNKRFPKLIVSLTSFPARIDTIHTVIISLLSQSVKPDKIILWLAESQFPNKENDLPRILLKLKKYGLEIKWCEDIRSYKKLIPSLKLYPDDIIVTADDDNIYDRKWLELMYKEYQKSSMHIQCHRVTKFYYDETEDKFSIIAGGKDFYKSPNYMNKLVGLGGALYPPHCFYKDVLDDKLFMELAPTSDDIWFWLMAALNNVRVNVVQNNISRANYVPGTQEGPSLTHINDHGEKLFWVHFNNMINHYPRLRNILKDDGDWK